MHRFIIRRLLFGILTLWLISTAVFTLSYWVPADPARTIAGPRATQAMVNAIRKDLGLDKPLIVQYWEYMKRLITGNLGHSYLNGGTSVFSLMKGSLPPTLWLIAGAAILWFFGGILAGVLSATKARSLLDRFITLSVISGLSFPPVVLALLVIYVFFYLLRVKAHFDLFLVGPAGSPFTNPGIFFQHMILPWCALAFLMVASYTRLTRSSLLETLGEDYIRTARAKGLSERRVIFKHGLRAALTPVITQFGVDVGALVGSAILTETIFGLNGFGVLIRNSVVQGDTPTVIGCTMVVAFFVVIANLIVDIGYSFLDPRVRVS
jgi:ABC-type dipeptide/oligopeptide/nickel transport system permease component